MNTLRVSELFYSLQGEGYRAGEPSVFIRLAGCNLACSFCDTEFDSGKPMTAAALLAWAGEAMRSKLDPSNAHPMDPWIVWTGGEPLLQLSTEGGVDAVQAFRSNGWKQAIETNGTMPLPCAFDWVACSPKVAEHVLEKSFPSGVDELRYVRHAGQPGIPQPRIPAKHLYLSPRSDGERINTDNLKHCIALCLANPRWKLSLQSHKLTAIL